MTDMIAHVWDIWEVWIACTLIAAGLGLLWRDGPCVVARALRERRRGK